MSVAVFQLADDSGQRVDRIWRHAAVGPGMKVDRRALRAQLRVKKAPERRGQGGVTVLVHAAVPDQDGIRLQIADVGAKETR